MKPYSCFIVFAMMLTCTIYAQQPADSIEVITDANYGLTIVKHRSSEKFGLIDGNGNFVLPPSYEYIFPFHDKLALVYDKDRFGYINLDGDIEIPIEYTTGNPFRNGKAIVSKNFSNGVIDTSNNIVIPFKYEILRTIDHSSYSFQFKPGASGLMDSEERILLEPIYDGFMKRNDSLWVVRKNKKFTILKNNGALHCSGEFDQIGKKNKANLSRFSIDKKVGFLDEHYQIAIPAQYIASGPATNQLVAVSNGKKWGFVDRTNTPITEFIYDKVRGLNDEHCIVVKDGISNVIDNNGHLKFEKGYKHIQHIANSDLIFMDAHLYDKAFNRKTTAVIRLADERFDGMENGMMKVYVDRKLGYVDSLGKMKILPKYEEGHHFYEENCTAVKKDGKWRFITTNDEPTSEMTYDSVSHFGSYNNCNYLTVKKNLYGYYSGKKVIFKPQFEELIIGEDESLIYRKGDKYGIINMQSFEIGEAIYDNIKAHLFGYEVTKESKVGFLDKSLNLRVPLAYEYLDHSGYYLIAKLNGKFGTISDRNEKIQDFVYDKIERIPFGFKRTYMADKIGMLSSNGTELLAPIYDNINAVNWSTVEVTVDGKTETINVAKLESENGDKGKREE